MSDRSRDLQDHHNEGQKDGSENKYEPPHSITPLDQLIYNESTIDELREDNDAYDKGYSHGRDQR